MKKMIYYINGDMVIIDEIRFLWEELNKHHKTVSPFFKEEFQTFTFSQRKSNLNRKYKNNNLRIDIAKEENKVVGYIISGINEDNVGVIESFFVRDQYRNMKIGDTLMKRALAWMESNNVRSKLVHVAFGNERAFGFYERFGFFPRVTKMKQKQMRI